MPFVSHLTFARFHDANMARACLRDLRRGQLWRPQMRIVISSTRKGHEELPLSLTHARGALVRGILVGAAVGLGAGLMISILEGTRVGINPTFVAMFCVFGLLMGGFAGALVGPMSPDPKVGKIEKSGDLVVAAESTEQADVDWAAAVFTTWGSQPQFRTTSSPLSERRPHLHNQQPRPQDEPREEPLPSNA